MLNEVLMIKEIAALLKLAEKTVYAMANSGEIPAFKIRGQWRIKRAELDLRIDAQPRSASKMGNPMTKAENGTKRRVPLHD